LSLSSLVFYSYLPHKNSDSYVLVLSGKVRKLSITFVFRRFAEKIVLVAISLIDPNPVLESGVSE
jgi:hypothetical protein